ncbi:histidine phosphatase family protein [Tahibacter caeni]|uniref:histidine phosphatase family protein n=1 Tax=Tahibacter caeni TaxID=1453545 RepID=UPI002147A524|nr:histidine phosphatase family protein [Tahibacter caeni]
MLVLMRHGTTGQPSYRGRLDDALSDLGWAQSRAAVADTHWDLLVSSTQRRCADFARELGAARGLPLRLDARLVEYDFGAWQGRRIDDLQREEPDALARYRADPERCPPPGGEDFAAFGRRVVAALDAANADPAQRVLVLTHGAVIRWVQCRLAGLPFGAMAETGIANASLHAVAWPGAATRGDERRGACV